MSGIVDDVLKSKKITLVGGNITKNKVNWKKNRRTRTRKSRKVH